MPENALGEEVDFMWILGSQQLYFCENGISSKVLCGLENL